MTTLASLRDEWQTNPRLRGAALLAAGIVGLWMLLMATDALDDRSAERDRVAQQVQRLQRMGSETFWPGYRDDLRQLESQLRGRAWREPSEARMQAAVQDWLRQQVSSAGLVPRELSAAVVVPAPSTRIPDAPVLPADMRVVRARLALEFQPALLDRLLARVAMAPGLTRITRLDIRDAERKWLEMDIEALFIQGEREVKP